MEDAGCPDGTSFFIRDLFYNVPARRKFLKSAVTEAGYINELVNRLAVSHCDIAFSLIIQGRTILHTSGNGKLKDCIYSVFSRDNLNYDLIVDTSVTSVNVSAAAIDSGATVSGVGTVKLTTGANKINIVVTAQNKTTRTYVLNIIRQSGGPVYSSGVGGINSGPGTQVITSPSVSGGNAVPESSGSSQPVIKIDSPVSSSGSTQQSSKTQSTVVLIGSGGQ